MELMGKLIEAKKIEEKKQIEEGKALKLKFKNDKPYQDAKALIAKLDKEIEGYIVKGEFLSNSVENMKITVDSLQSKKETLVEEKKMSLSRRDELKVQWKSQEEMREKRL